MVSSVLFESAEIVPGLDSSPTRAAGTARAARRRLSSSQRGAVRSGTIGLDDAFITGGGYKYCQLGEGNAFLRVPPGLAASGAHRLVRVVRHVEDRGRRGRIRRRRRAFAGATYDPTSHYRAAAVFAFHEQQGLTPDGLRQISRRQVACCERVRGARHAPSVAHVEPMPEERRAGFLAIRAPGPDASSSLLRARGVTPTHGGDAALGPAPYLRDDQLRDAIRALERSVAGSVVT